MMGGPEAEAIGLKERSPAGFMEKRMASRKAAKGPKVPGTSEVPGTW